MFDRLKWRLLRRLPWVEFRNDKATGYCRVHCRGYEIAKWRLEP
jgi:hypothetical protein